ncbi:macrolide family glycosyltransferase [Nonomuraea sp. NPDC050540]|uniref:macrolide family glycosyltransferase n=1 Tax=Nonomuraea sp. NPDC050540 TaxID=3364367 RepID=UPI00379FF091
MTQRNHRAPYRRYPYHGVRGDTLCPVLTSFVRMARHYLFMCQPDHGHVIPNLAVVAELVRRGNRVTYVTGESMADVVRAAGATVIGYDSIYHKADLRRLEDDPLGLISLFLDESRVMLESVGSEKADVVVYDISVLHAGRILARKWGRPAVQLIPVFASNEHFSYLSSIYGDGGAGGALPGWVDDMLARTAALAHDHGVDVPPADLWWQVQDFSLVNLPRSFQFAGETFDERFAFVGPCLGERSFLSDWTPPGDGRPIALLTFGTVASSRPDLFRTCVRAFGDLPWHTVVTVPEAVDLGPLPANVEVRRWVSHMSVLRHADVAVTHGGMGTAMEALYWGRPTVIVPATAIDGPPARRVAELGLGRVVDPAELTPERLVADVLAVVSDDRVRQATAAMAREIREAGGTTRAADELERYPA